MNFKHTPTPRLVSKFIASYDKLFEGFSPQQIAPHESPTQFWSSLLSLKVDISYLGGKFRIIDKDALLTFHKPFINELFSSCLFYLRTVSYGDSRKINSMETLSVVLRCCLEKNLAGWEAMELFAGGVAESDTVFLDFVGIIDTILSDESASADIKHRVLQLAVVFACSINQLSPGAYLLRKNFFPALLKMIKDPETQAFGFEAALLLAIISNFHRTDAAKLNPCLQSVKEVEDREMLKCICYTANYTMDSVIKSYQEISDDSPPTFASSMSNLFASFRPDRALSATPVDPHRELFKNQPVEAAVILLPIHDFIRLNPVFNAVLLEPLMLQQQQQTASEKASLPPLLYTLLSMSSYVLSHASSIASPRATAYANLCLATFLDLVENDVAMSSFLQPGLSAIRLCRQRQPPLPQGANNRPAIGALLDCCVLWLRHNFHKKLEVRSYVCCTWVLQRVIWFLSKTKRRLEYHWEELWRALNFLLDFLANKTEVAPSSRAERLVQETVLLLDCSIRYAESFLPSPSAVHQLVYELVRSSSVLQKHHTVFSQTTHRSPSKSANSSTAAANAAYHHLIDVVSHYEGKVQESGVASSAVAVLRVISKEVERDGLFGGKEQNEEEAPKHADELGEVGFIRFACADGLALMPGPD
ncbi:hypothetical protein SCHPADRAFT_873602 [Schizopora paradoxa]|uniref:Armadillo-like helical domain-containing protein n=1 Tax=Schizopora paradoxa TaxID=27342 RepID=A0A0H2SA57_9AGAM|nr:hypothetical protein SCHPADRAFT_873602 [Schizopora paradoxa]